MSRCQRVDTAKVEMPVFFRDTTSPDKLNSGLYFCRISDGLQKVTKVPMRCNRVLTQGRGFKARIAGAGCSSIIANFGSVAQGPR